MNKKSFKKLIKECIEEMGDDFPLYVEYHSDRQGESPFILNGAKYQFVNAKYPDGKIDIGVYSFAEDLVYSYDAFRKQNNIKEDLNQPLKESKIICAWCQKQLGTTGEKLDSHGICKDCKEKIIKKYAREKEKNIEEILAESMGDPMYAVNVESVGNQEIKYLGSNFYEITLKQAKYFSVDGQLPRHGYEKKADINKLNNVVAVYKNRKEPLDSRNIKSGWILRTTYWGNKEVWSIRLQFKHVVGEQGWEVKSSKKTENIGKKYIEDARKISYKIWGGVYLVSFHSTSENDKNVFYKVVLHSPNGDVRWLVRNSDGKWEASTGHGVESKWEPIDKYLNLEPDPSMGDLNLKEEVNNDEFEIVYIKNGKAITIPIEAADLETARKAANQWRVKNGISNIIVRTKKKSFNSISEMTTTGAVQGFLGKNWVDPDPKRKRIKNIAAKSMPGGEVKG